MPFLAGAKTGFLRHLYINAIFLPRQARDTHRENSIKWRFLAAVMLRQGTFGWSDFERYLPDQAIQDACKMVVPVRSSSSSSLSKLRTPFGLCLLLFVLLLLLIVRVLLCPAFPTAADNMNAFYLSRRQVQDDRVEPPATNNFAATVAITTADGTVHETIIPVPSGEARQSRLQLSCAKPPSANLSSRSLSHFSQVQTFSSPKV